MIKGRPCKIVDMSKAKVGKDGAAKCHFIGVDIFTAKKFDCICPSSAGLSQPIVEHQEYQLCDIDDDGFISLMTGGGDMRDDIKLPEDEVVAKKLQERYEGGLESMLTVLKAMGHEQVIDIKHAQV